MRSFGFLQGASLRSSEVVRVVRRAMDDWPANTAGEQKNHKNGKTADFEWYPSKKQKNAKQSQFQQPKIDRNLL